MSAIAHLLVLSQPEFLDRQVGSALAEPRPGTRVRQLLRAWFEFKASAPVL